MKRKIILFPALLILLICILPACDIFGECGTCEWVSIDADDIETRTAPQPFCNDELLERQNDVPETIDGVTTYWDCY